MHPLIFQMLLSELFNNNDLEKYQVQSTGIKNFKFEVFSVKQMVLLPDIEIQKQFVSYVIPIKDCIQTLADQNVNLRRTRDLLLPKLISGELDVSELDIRIPEAEA
jgi:type I restriction enzyme S subunit